MKRWIPVFVTLLWSVIVIPTCLILTLLLPQTAESVDPALDPTILSLAIPLCSGGAWLVVVAPVWAAYLLGKRKAATQS